MAGHTDAHTSAAAEPPEARAAARALEAWKGHAEYYRLKAEGWEKAAADLQRQLDEARQLVEKWKAGFGTLTPEETISIFRAMEDCALRRMLTPEQRNLLTDRRLRSAEAANQELRHGLRRQVGHLERIEQVLRSQPDVPPLAEHVRIYRDQALASLGPQHGDTK